MSGLRRDRHVRRLARSSDDTDEIWREAPLPEVLLYRDGAFSGAKRRRKARSPKVKPAHLEAEKT